MTEHVFYVCDGRCDGRACMFCDGGLSACTVCGAFEGAWTTECPGFRVSERTWQEVYRGETDFRDGQWTDEPSPHSPYGLRKLMDQGNAPHPQ